MSGPWDNYRTATQSDQPAGAPWLKYQASPKPNSGPGGAAKSPPGSGHISNLAPLSQATDVASTGSGTPVQSAMDAQSGAITPIDDPTMLPKIEATGAASFAKSPAIRAAYLARKLFPDMSPNEALQRIGHDGSRLYYIANDGKAYYAEPKFAPIDQPGQTLKELPDTLASQVGPALPTIFGMGGGILGGPTPASVVSAAGGGMLGESIRQAGARAFTGELQPVTDSLLSVAQEGVGQGVNQALGLGLAKVGSSLLERNPLRVSGYDASKMTPARVSEMQANADLARRHGIDVTPGEAGNVGSLLVNQRQIARQNEGADILKDFYAKRNTDQIPDAWVRYLDQVSPQGSSALANRELGAAAKDTVQAGRTARSDLATPKYTEAFAANQSMASPELDRILQTPAGQSALKSAATTMQNKMSLLGVSDPELTALKTELVSIGKMTDPNTGAGVASGLKLETYDLIKRKLYELEQAAKNPQTGASTTDSNAIADLRKGLTSQLDKLDTTAVTQVPLTAADLLKRYPGAINANRRAQILAQQKPQSPGLYAQARKIFENESPAVTEVEKGIVGIAAKDKRTALQNLPKVLFSATSSDSYSIAQAKSAFQKAGKMDEWNAGIRSFLQNTFDDAVKAGGDAGPSNNLWKNISGNKRQMSNLKAALGPGQFDALNDFMKVVEMVKRAPAEGSQTATDLGSRGSFAGPVAKGTAAVVKGANPLNIPEMASAKIIETSSGKNIEALAKLITAPDAIASLKRLRVLKPGTKAFVREIGYLSSVAGWSAAGSALNPQAPMQPGTIPEAVQ